MALRENLRNIAAVQYEAHKKNDLKIEFENALYKLLLKEFDQANEGAHVVRLELLQQKNEILTNILPPGFTLYERRKNIQQNFKLYLQGNNNKQPARAIRRG